MIKKLLLKIFIFFSPVRTCVIHSRIYPGDFIVHYKYVFKKRYILAKTKWDVSTTTDILCRCSVLKN